MKQSRFDNLLKWIIVFLFTLSMTWDSNASFNLILFLICFVLVYIVFSWLWKILAKVKLNNPKGKINKFEYLLYGLLILIPLVCTIIAHYPGVISPDVVGQYKQALNNSYTNWHPVMHTLIMFKLPLLFYEGLISPVIFQCFLIFIILLYFCHFCRRNFLSFKQTCGVLLLIVLNPLFLRFSVTLWKDVIYSWSIFLVTLFIINIILSNGEWLQKNTNKIWLIIGSLPILLFRHNGIVSFALIFIGLAIFFAKWRKYALISLFTILIANFIITGPVYKSFKIDNRTGGKSEMIGLVMGQISYYYYNSSSSFTEDELAVLNDVTPLVNWKKYYNPRNFNFTKYTSDNYTKKVEKNFSALMKIWLTHSLKSPAKFTKSFLNMTSPLWETRSQFMTNAYIMYEEKDKLADKGDFKETSDLFLEQVVTYNNVITNTPLRWLFVDIGGGLVLILTALALVLRKTKWNLKYTFPFWIVLSNTFVIMLLITGEEYRFVYAQAICVIPLFLYCLAAILTKKNIEKCALQKLVYKLTVAKTDNTLIQFIRYIFVGGVAAIVNIGMLYVFTEALNIHYLISNILAFTLGLIVNYILSKKLVFQEKTNFNKGKEFLIYAIIGVLGLGLDTLIISLLTTKLKLYYMLSKIISTMLVFIWNFVARKVLYKIIK